ncbi:MAG: hypothetical protein JRJ29_00265 [Deltaproteobacteria bacterium]|nr:hypothetical protein [Deltaproteobacteria bacterium]MBW2081597.1 hypothetical protein [Deltaproteobacteria bacterium]
MSTTTTGKLKAAPGIDLSKIQWVDELKPAPGIDLSRVQWVDGEPKKEESKQETQLVGPVILPKQKLTDASAPTETDLNNLAEATDRFLAENPVTGPIGGLAETAYTLGTGMFAYPASLAVSAYKFLTGSSKEEAKKAGEKVAEALTYKPKSEYGKTYTHWATWPIQKISEFWRAVGEAADTSSNEEYLRTMDELGLPYMPTEATTTFLEYATIGALLKPLHVAGGKFVESLKPAEIKTLPGDLAKLSVTSNEPTPLLRPQEPTGSAPLPARGVTPLEPYIERWKPRGTEPEQAINIIGAPTVTTVIPERGAPIPKSTVRETVIPKWLPKGEGGKPIEVIPPPEPKPEVRVSPERGAPIPTSKVRETVTPKWGWTKESPVEVVPAPKPEKVTVIKDTGPIVPPSRVREPYVQKWLPKQEEAKPVETGSVPKPKPKPEPPVDTEVLAKDIGEKLGLDYGGKWYPYGEDGPFMGYQFTDPDTRSTFYLKDLTLDAGRRKLAEVRAKFAADKVVREEALRDEKVPEATKERLRLQAEDIRRAREDIEKYKRMLLYMRTDELITAANDYISEHGTFKADKYGRALEAELQDRQQMIMRERISRSIGIDHSLSSEEFQTAATDVIAQDALSRAIGEESPISAAERAGEKPFGEGFTVEAFGLQRMYEAVCNAIRKAKERFAKRAESLEDWERQRRLAEETGGDPEKIIKRRRISKYKGLYKPAITEVEKFAMQALPDLEPRILRSSSGKWGAGWVENPIRVFEQLGQKAMDLFYYPVRDAIVAARREHLALREQLKQMRKELGINRKSEKRIGAYAVAQQRGGVEILNKMGVEIPELSPNEMKMYEFIRDKLDEFYERLNDARIAIGKEPFNYQEDYFTFFRLQPWYKKLGFKVADHEYAPLIDTEVIDLVNLPFRYAKHRRLDLLMKSKGVRLDALDMFDKYAGHTLESIYLAKPLAKGRELLLDLDGFKLREAAPNTYTFLRKWLDQVSGKPADTMLPKPIAIMVQKLTHNVAASILTYNFRTALVQPTAIINTYAKIGGKYTLEGIRGILDPKTRAFIKKHSALLAREFDVTIADISHTKLGRLAKYKSQIVSAGTWPLRYLDMETARATWWGAYKYAREVRGYSMERAIRYADDTVVKTQGSGHRIDVAPIQTTIEGKAATLFQTFTINNWNFLVKDVLGIKNKHIPLDVAMKRVARYMVAAAITNIVFEDLLGIPSPMPAPIKGAYRAYKKDKSVLGGAASEGIEIVPVIGGPVKYGSSVGGPLLELAQDVAQKASGTPGPQASWLNIAGRAAGVPGTAQISKTTKRLTWGQSLPEAIVGSGMSKPRQSSRRRRRTRPTRRNRSRR